MSGAALPRKPDEITLRKAAGVLFLMGSIVGFSLWKIEAFSGLEPLFLWAGGTIWIFWLARVLLPGLPHEIRLMGCSVSLGWHLLLLLPAPLYLMNPAGIGVLFLCAMAAMIAFAGIRYDQRKRRVW